MDVAKNLNVMCWVHRWSTIEFPTSTTVSVRRTPMCKVSTQETMSKLPRLSHHNEQENDNEGTQFRYLTVLIVSVHACHTYHQQRLKATQRWLVNLKRNRWKQGRYMQHAYLVLPLYSVCYLHVHVHVCQRGNCNFCLLYTSPSPRDATLSRMPSSA